MTAARKAKSEPVIELSASLYNGEVTIQRGDFGSKKHAYYWLEKGYFVPGVTSILSILDKPALLPWAAGLAARYVQANMPESATPEQIEEVCGKAKSEWRSVRDAAGDIGTQVHAVAESLFKGEPIALPTDPLAINGVKALQQWIGSHQIQPIDVERIVFSKAYFLAGTMDLLAAVDGKLSEVDFKTGSGIYPEHMLQTAIYRDMWQEENKEEIEQIIIVNLNKKTGKPKIETISDRAEMQLYRDTFLRTKALKENLDKMRKW